MFVYSDSDFGKLLEKWDLNTTPVSNLDGLGEAIRKRQALLLINPWGELQNHKTLTSVLRCYIQQHSELCFIFGGVGEVELFGEEQVQTGHISIETYRTTLEKMRENQDTPQKES